MVKGRNTTRISIRLPDEVVIALKKRAEQLGIPRSMFIRHFMQEKLGLKKT